MRITELTRGFEHKGIGAGSRPASDSPDLPHLSAVLANFSRAGPETILGFAGHSTPPLWHRSRHRQYTDK